jgi:hypothetical protein
MQQPIAKPPRRVSTPLFVLYVLPHIGALIYGAIFFTRMPAWAVFGAVLLELNLILFGTAAQRYLHEVGPPVRENSGAPGSKSGDGS